MDMDAFCSSRGSLTWLGQLCFMGIPDLCLLLKGTAQLWPAAAARPHVCLWLPAGSTGETGTRSGASLSDLTYSDVSQPGSAGSEQAST